MRPARLDGEARMRVTSTNIRPPASYIGLSTCRIEIPNGHRFITEVVEAFPGEIESVGLHKPTLEDVFVRETGATLDE